jgi:iron complex transport system ATP-binding protein
MSSLSTHDLQVTIGGKTVCDALTVNARTGENWALLGANGSGKTTLLHTLAGLRQPAAGGIQLNDQDLDTYTRRARAQQLGILFQDHGEVFPADVLETVLSGRHPHLGRWTWEDAADMDLATTALAEVGLSGFEQRSLDTLSGGERRRVAIAALLCQNPPVCLWDEPTNHLDLHHQVQILTRLADRAGRPGHLNIFVLHDINLALRVCTHGLLLLGNGETIQGPAHEIITPATLEQVYGCPIRAVTDGASRIYLPA